MAEVNIQGLSTSEAAQAAAEARASGKATMHTFEVDNTTGRYKLPLGKQEVPWLGTTRDEAKEGLAAHLATILVPEQSTATSRATQHTLEETLPPLAAIAGGIAGVPLAPLTGGIVNPVTLAGASSTVAHLATRGTQAYLTPEEYQQQTAGNWPNVAGEAAMRGLEGSLGQYLAKPAGQFLAGPLRNKIFSGSASGPELTPTQERLYGEGVPGTPPTYGPGMSPSGPPTPRTPTTPPGPFTAGAELTGQQAYPRLSQVYQNWFTSLSDRFAQALFAGNARTGTGRTGRNIVQGRMNLDAYATKLAEDLTTANDPRDLARTLNQLIDTGTKEVLPYQSGLWKAADAQAVAASGGAPILVQTTADINRLTAAPTTIGGQRPQVMADLQKAVTKELEGRAVEQTFNERNFTRTSESFGDVTTRTGESTNVQADARKLRGTETASGSTTTSTPGTPGGGLTPPTPAESVTVGGSTTEGTRIDQPLAGRLHTFNPETGAYDEHITLGDAMGLRSAIGNVIGQARNPSMGLQDADIRVARSWYADLTKRIDTVLDTLDPTLRAAYTQARDATHEMYAQLQAKSLLETMRLSENNPAALDNWFFNNGGLQRMDTLRSALRYVDRVPGTTINGEQWFDLNIQPRLRYQALWRASNTSLGPGDTDPLVNLQQAASSRPDIQQAIQNKELVSLKPGALSKMHQELGDEQFQAIMGSTQIGERFLDLDKALQINARLSDPASHIYVLMTQTGGMSRMMNAAGALTLGAAGIGHSAIPPLVNLIGGVGGGATLLFGPAIINYLATDPALFRSMALGIRTGNVSMITRIAAQLAVHAVRKEVQDNLRSGKPAQGSAPPNTPVHYPLTPSGAGTSAPAVPPAPGQ